jgi:Protein of unknown function (DUF541)
MKEFETPSISVKEQISLEVKPDVALIKLHVTGEGMLMVDAVESARNKVAEITERLKSAHDRIERIDIFDVYFGQKEERFRAEAQAYPRPLVIQGILVTARPDEPTALYRIMDDGIKRGAILGNPHGRSYMTDTLDSSLLFGLVASEPHEQEAIHLCLKRAEQRCGVVAAATHQKVGKLLEVSGVTVEPSMRDAFKSDFVHIRRTFPTTFLSPTPHKVLICATLTAKYAVLQA